MRVRRWIVAAATAVTIAPTMIGSAQADPVDEIHYVALGDSFAAGSGVLPAADLATCGRSAINYPALVSRALGPADFTDVTCGGATLADLGASQPGLVSGAAAPQLDALTAETTLVTMTMGGNDIGLADDALRCGNPLPEPFGISCADHFTANGIDTFAERLSALPPTYTAAIDQIRRHAPRARIVLVGYPTAARPGGCPGQQPVWTRDLEYLQNVLIKLNALLSDIATTQGLTFVDTANSSVGHDMCAPPNQQWINGLIPADPLAAFVPLHPNAAGEQNMATQVLAAL